MTRLQLEEHELALADSRFVAHFLVLLNMIIKTQVIKEEVGKINFFLPEGCCFMFASGCMC